MVIFNLKGELSTLGEGHLLLQARCLSPTPQPWLAFHLPHPLLSTVACVLTQPQAGSISHYWTWSPTVLGTGSWSQDAQGGGLVFSSMTPFRFVRKRISVLPSVSAKAMSGFLQFPNSPSRCPPGDRRLCCLGITSGAPSSSPDAPDTGADLSNRGRGFPMPPWQICTQIHSPVPLYRLDHPTSTPVFSPTRADFSHLNA